MALISCPGCSARVSSIAYQCPKCAHPIMPADAPPAAPQSGHEPLAVSAMLPIGILTVAVAIGCGVYVSLRPGPASSHLTGADAAVSGPPTGHVESSRIHQVTVGGEFACLTRGDLRQVQRCIAQRDAVGFEALIGVTCFPVPARIPVSVFTEDAGDVEVVIKDFGATPGTRWWMDHRGIEAAPEEILDRVTSTPSPPPAVELAPTPTVAPQTKAERPASLVTKRAKPGHGKSRDRASGRLQDREESDYEIDPVEPYETEDDLEHDGADDAPVADDPAVESPAVGGDKNHERVLPRVVRGVDGRHPDGLPQPHRHVVVKLNLLVGVTGGVEDCTVAHGDDPAYVREARRVGFRLRFEPGTVDGTPTPMWIPWVVTFEPQ